MGYTAERIVASRLTEDGYLVSIPDSATQPGFDLIVDGKEFQVKCIEPENYGILDRHFEKYPDTPVITNAEMAEVIADRAPDWANQVFFVEGYTYEFANKLTRTSLAAGAELSDYELIPFIAAISTVRNVHGWWIAEQSLGESAFNVTIDSASKGIMAVAGGFAGKGLGMLVFGPAGAYVFGGAVAVAAATKGNWISEWVDVALNPDRDRAYDDAAKQLLLNCIGHLEAKVIGIESKVDALPNGGIADAMRFRWEWEMIFVKSKINEADHLQQSGTKSGGRKAIEALELAYNCGVHPIWLQKNYTELLSLLSEPKNRLVNVKRNGVSYSSLCGEKINYSTIQTKWPITLSVNMV